MNNRFLMAGAVVTLALVLLVVYPVLLNVNGILDVLDNYAFVRTSGYLPGPNDVYVSLAQVKKNNLRKGDAVVGAIRAPREGEENQRGQRQRSSRRNHASPPHASNVMADTACSARSSQGMVEAESWIVVVCWLSGCLSMESINRNAARSPEVPNVTARTSTISSFRRLCMR